MNCEILQIPGASEVSIQKVNPFHNHESLYSSGQIILLILFIYVCMYSFQFNILHLFQEKKNLVIISFINAIYSITGLTELDWETQGEIAGLPQDQRTE